MEITDCNQRRVIQLSDNSTGGTTENYFFEESAKYDISLSYFESSAGNASIEILINGKSAGRILFGSSNTFRERTVQGVNIQKWSKITLVFAGEGGEKCRVEKMVLTPSGKFDAKFEKLPKPQTLDIFETVDAKNRGRQVFVDYVRINSDRLWEERTSELDRLRNPSEWRARQAEVRKRLPLYFGEFPPRSPLNSKILGTLDYEKYTVEKIIFESQPGYYVPANLYIPKDRKYPLPGVIFSSGHYNDAKVAEEYQMSFIGLVLKGYVVLAYDPMGQGERSEYFDRQTLNLSLFNRQEYNGVEQHHYVRRPALLVDWTLAGLRTWDGIRAIDYLESRPEVDPEKLAAVGQSGGGQMAMLITAADERIKVCAVSHPGGSCESMYLTGLRLIDQEIFSLIPPRPIRIIVGTESNEESGHRRKLEDMQLFYQGLNAGQDCADLVLVPGIHSLSKANREEVYEWLNKWFDKEYEGKTEGIFQSVDKKLLWCTDRGNSIVALNGETGQTLNEKRAMQFYKPEKDPLKFRDRVVARTGMNRQTEKDVPGTTKAGKLTYKGIRIEKFTYTSEQGIPVPALLFIPRRIKTGDPVFIFASDKGKPDTFKDSALPFLLAENGYMVMAVDVRGTGETAPTPLLGLHKYVGYSTLLRQHESLDLQCPGFGQTTAGLKAYDIQRGIDYLYSRSGIRNKEVVVIGEGSGGLWAMLAAINDRRITGIVCKGTLPSYFPLISNQYYKLWGYFSIPGVLKDFDIPDLVSFLSPKRQIWIDPVNELDEKMSYDSASSLIGTYENLKIIISDHNSVEEMLEVITGSKR